MTSVTVIQYPLPDSNVVVTEINLDVTDIRVMEIRVEQHGDDCYSAMSSEDTHPHTDISTGDLYHYLYDTLSQRR